MTIKNEICPQVKADVRLCDDGTLWIKTEKLDKVGRVIVEHGTSCKQFYQDAKPKQPTGKWIKGHCSECGTHAPYWAMASTYHESNFCPHCGAKMEGSAE